MYSFVTQIAENFKISENKDTAEEDDAILGKYFPNFIWVIRDFCLQLNIDGEEITSDDYLESALGLKKGCHYH